MEACPTPKQIGQRLERARTEAAPRRGVVGTILLHRIEDTDPIVEANALPILALGALVGLGMWFVIISVLEKVFG
jgi:hypothetical protein